ncbi:MAG: hypothetical protein IPL11_13735 [Candidatus Accumulibacter sp.]|nr:hypothetical protein [Accumulibacter sp.]
MEIQIRRLNALPAAASRNPPLAALSKIRISSHRTRLNHHSSMLLKQPAHDHAGLFGVEQPGVATLKGA